MSFAFQMAGFLALSGCFFLFVLWVASEVEEPGLRADDCYGYPPEGPFAGVRFFIRLIGFICAAACFVVAGLFSITGTILAIAGVG